MSDAPPRKSYARDMANVPREVKKHREAGLPEFERAHRSILGEFIRHDDLLDIIHTAIRVGRGTATVKKLTAMLEPYGIRRKT